MTDNPDPPDTAAEPVRPRTVSDNVRAEIARANETATSIRIALDRAGIKISRTTWAERMNDPGSWRMSELLGIAAVLAVPPSRFVT